MTISLLIPVCDYDIVALVHSMKSCIGNIPEFLEILIGDDGSSQCYRDMYKGLEGNGVRVIVSEKNIGRAAIRNKLALEANGDFLLFIDADTWYSRKLYNEMDTGDGSFKCYIRRYFVP